jgi:L,D-transpeptidase catalytic domain
MNRVIGIVSAAVVISRLTCTGALAVPTDDLQRQDAPHLNNHGNSIEPTGSTVASHIRASHHHKRKTMIATRGETRPERVYPEGTRPDEGRPEVEDQRPGLTSLPASELSAQELRVSQIAAQNGDQTFLMVDKSLGKIILFEYGQPVFKGQALTGESTADRLPPTELTEKFAKLDALDTKITPAGRFTVARGFDKEYGPLFDIKEIKGKDWAIAIHQVYLGIPSEHRAARLQSPRYDDKNITFGCINVAPTTIQLLLQELPEKGTTVLYVLPRDETKTASYLAAHNS